MNLTAKKKEAIKKMLEDDIPIPIIAKNLNLEDADFIYEVLYESNIKNRTYTATEKFRKARAFRQDDDSYAMVVKAVKMLYRKVGTLKILEQGCGDGSFANQIAQTFPDCTIDAIELTEAGVRHANEKYKRKNLKVWQEDGFKIKKHHHYDIVYHLNVVEHVECVEQYLEVGLNNLNRGGLLIFGFPSERYWKFWGFFKYMACRVLKRPFLTHAYPDHLIDDFLEQKGLYYNKYYNGLYLPRRLYYYFSDRILEFVGKRMGLIETELKKMSLYFPMMFVFYVVSSNRPFIKNYRDENFIPYDNPGVLKKIGTLSALFFFWTISNAFMTLEVLQKRKTFFQQK